MLFLVSWKNLFSHLCVVKCCTSWNTQLRFISFWVLAERECELQNLESSGFWTHGVLLPRNAGVGRLCTSFLPHTLLSFKWLSWTWKYVECSGQRPNQTDSPDLGTQVQCFPSCYTSPLWDAWSIQRLLYQRFYYLLKSKNLVLNSCTPHNSLHVTDLTSSFVL